MMQFATTLFCDDIRFEIGNKRTYVGCFDGALIVEELPAVLPRLCASVTLYLSRFPDTDTDVEARIFLPGDAPEKPSFTSETKIPGGLKPPPMVFSDASDANPRLKIQQDFVLSPVEIKQAGLISVRLAYGAESIRAGSLEIRLTEVEGPAS